MQLILGRDLHFAAPWEAFDLDELPREVEIDLGSVTFALPHGIVSLASLIDWLTRQEVAVSVRAPRNPDVARYITRTHLPEFMSQRFVSHDFPQIRERDQGMRMVELVPVTNSESVAGLAESVFWFAKDHDEETAKNLYRAVCELGENIPSHAGTDMGFLFAQYFPYKRRYQFALADSGVGPLAKLATRGASSHAHALTLAVTPGVSSSRDATRGYGLSTIRETLINIGGNLNLASGDSFVTFNRHNVDGRFASLGGVIRGLVAHGEVIALAK
ncbi:hypothetical protein [Agreia sp. VKM Ac-1783]|uniref:hypothetical protein n=1 Tax=Agreia sp. VKM Ac-1783 TaxID=1938889 RepID=UPI001123026C|nr:hypothetical protein [Agreia sp. VKM Ac-1783]